MSAVMPNGMTRKETGEFTAELYLIGAQTAQHFFVGGAPISPRLLQTRYWTCGPAKLWRLPGSFFALARILQARSGAYHHAGQFDKKGVLYLRGDTVKWTTGSRLGITVY